MLLLEYVELCKIQQDHYQLYQHGVEPGNYKILQYNCIQIEERLILFLSEDKIDQKIPYSLMCIVTIFYLNVKIFLTIFVKHFLRRKVICIKFYCDYINSIVFFFFLTIFIPQIDFSHKSFKLRNWMFKILVPVLQEYKS